MDFITNLSSNIKSGVKILLIITNRLNKGIILIPILLIFTPAVAAAFIKYYISYHGFSKAIINDKETQFTSTVWTIIYKALRIERRLSLAYHPETDGATEYANQVIQPYLRAYTTFSQDN